MIGLMEGRNGARTERLEDSINSEITYRTKVVSTFDFSLGEELFYFGRPLFHQLVSIGADITEVDRRLLLSWPDRKINL